MPSPPRLRFTRHMRMSSGKDFDRAFRLGGRAKGKLVSVVASANGGAHTRLGLSVGRACWKGAVQRNRVRRVFREAFRLSYADLPKGCDLVLMPATPKLAPTLGEVQAELGALARKAWAKRKASEGPPRVRGDAAGGAQGT